MRTLLCLTALLFSACNSAPGPVEILLEPSEPYVGDDLVVVITSDSVDSDAKDSVEYRYSWFQDGQSRTDLSTNRVDSAETTKNELWKVIVVPSDGELDGPPIAAEVLVLNSPPSIDALVLDNEAPLSTDNVVGTATSSDADQDEVTLSYVWKEAGGEKSVESAELTSTDTSHGEVWTLTVTPSDDEDTGESEAVSVEIGNTEPVITSVSITPETAYADSTLTAVVEATDSDPEDEGSLTYTYEWAVNGTVIVGQEADTLSGWFDKHDEVTVAASAFDGFAHGEIETSEALVISNTVPAFTGVSLDPAELFEATTVTCTSTGWADVDGDPEGYVYAWFVGGQSIPLTSASIDGSQFDRGDPVSCSAQAYDGEAFGNILQSEELDVGNTAPSLVSVSLSSTSPQEGFTLTASIQGAADVDGDAISYLYEWVVEDTSANQAFFSTETLTGADFSRGDSIYVFVTPTDGDKDGIAVQSDTAVVVNTAPVMGTVSLDPSALYTDTIVGEVLDSVSDDDGDVPIETHEWFVDGASVAITPTLDGASFFDKGQEVYVAVTQDDGFGGVVSANSNMVTVGNTPPGAPTISLAPHGAEPGVDDLVCSMDVDAYDADSDTLTYTFTWEMDGSAYTGTPVETTTTSTIPTADLDYDQSWTCTVSTTDGADSGADVSTSVSTAYEYACNSLDFDENVYVSIPDASELDLLYSEYTLEAWVYASELGFYACPFEGGANTIASKRSSAGYELSVVNCVSNAPALRFNENNDGSFIDGSDTLSEGVWHHVATSVTGGQAYLWLDGELQGTGSVSSTGDTASPLTIGRDSVSTTYGPYPWRGHIRDVRISDTARYLSGFTPGELSVDVDTVGFWAIDEGSGSAIQDSSGYGNDGMVVGTPSWQAVCQYEDADGDGYAVWEDCDDNDFGSWGGSSPCNACSSVSFSSVGWVDVGSHASLIQPNPTLTVEAWLKWDGSWDGGGNYAQVALSSLGASGGWNVGLENGMYWSSGIRTSSGADGLGNGLSGFEALANHWTHIAVVMEDTGTTTERDVFINGLLTGSKSFSGSPVLTGSEVLLFGNQADSYGSNRQFPGEISGVRISSSARYTSDFSPALTLQADVDTLGLWEFSEGSGSLASDITGSGYDGTLSGASWVGTCPDDGDNDGYGADEDCDDNDASVYPLAGDTYGDGVDSDCDGMDCEAGLNAAQDSYFLACPAETDWQSAEAACQAAGYDGLASILDSSEQSLLESMRPDSDQYMWIGYTDQASEGTFSWSNGDTGSYDYWLGGQPDDGAGAGEDCALMFKSSRGNEWNDYSCSGSDYNNGGEPIGAFCSYRIDTCVPYGGDTYGDGVDSDCDGMDCEATLLGDDYFVFCPDYETTWDLSNQACLDAGYDGLTSILDADEQNLVTSLIADAGGATSERPWIGLNPATSSTWEDGNAVNYTYWASGEPNGPSSFCGHMNRDADGTGTWNDLPCDDNGLWSLVCGVRGIVDQDGDGYAASEDCDDSDPSRHLGGSLVPVLSSNTSAESSDGIVVSASSEHNSGNFEAWKAFNGTTSTQTDAWHSDARGSNTSSHPEWIEVDLGANNSALLNEVSLTSRNYDQHRFSPITYQVEGSNDGANWTVLVDVVNDTSITGQAATISHSVSSTSAYRYFLLNIDEVDPNSITSETSAALGELELVGCYDSL